MQLSYILNTWTTVATDRTPYLWLKEYKGNNLILKSQRQFEKMLKNNNEFIPNRYLIEDIIKDIQNSEVITHFIQTHLSPTNGSSLSSDNLINDNKYEELKKRNY